MNQIQNRLDRALYNVEQGLNTAGYIPLVSTVSGALRANLGKLEIIGSVAAGSLLAIKALFNPTAEGRNRELDKAVEIVITYSLHGLANIFRAILEIFPFVSLATCLPYDHLFKQRFSYPTETTPLPVLRTAAAG